MTTFYVCLGIFVFFVLSGFRLDREYERGVIFRLGRLNGVRGPGLYWVIPLVDQKVQVDLRTRTVDIESQETVTSDSVTIKVNAVLYYRVHAPDKAITVVSNYQQATYQMALTTLRNVIGQHLLDEVLRDRDKINLAVRKIVDEVTSQWGLRVELVEMKDVEIPAAMQRAMAKEAEAVRERRSRLIKAEAERESAKLLAEASDSIAANPYALELRRMQMVSEVGAENNSTTIMLIPSEFVTFAKDLAAKSVTMPMPPQAA